MYIYIIYVHVVCEQSQSPIQCFASNADILSGLSLSLTLEQKLWCVFGDLRYLLMHLRKIVIHAIYFEFASVGTKCSISSQLSVCKEPFLNIR